MAKEGDAVKKKSADNKKKKSTLMLLGCVRCFLLCVHVCVCVFESEFEFYFAFGGGVHGCMGFVILICCLGPQLLSRIIECQRRVIESENEKEEQEEGTNQEPNHCCKCTQQTLDRPGIQPQTTI